MIVKSVNTRRALSLLVFYILCLLVLVIVAYPVLWMLLGSLKESWEVTTYPFSLPLQPTLENYWEAWQVAKFGRAFINSIFITAVSLGGILTISTMAFFDFKVLILSTFMLSLYYHFCPAFAFDFCLPFGSFLSKTAKALTTASINVSGLGGQPGA